MHESGAMTDSVGSLVDAMLAIDRQALAEIFARAMADGTLTLVDSLVVPALEYIGARWEQGEVSLSQVYMSGRLCEELIDGLGQSQLDAQGFARATRAEAAALRIGISTLDDYHLLGKRMVCAVLRASGYKVRDYGTTDTETLATATLRDDLQVLLISVLMLPSALRVKELRSALNAAGHHPRILVGGAPFRFDPNLYLEVGADAAGATAADALALVRAAAEALQ